MLRVTFNVRFYIFNFQFLCPGLQYFYHRLLRRTLHRPVRCSATTLTNYSLSVALGYGDSISLCRLCFLF